MTATRSLCAWGEHVHVFLHMCRIKRGFGRDALVMKPLQMLCSSSCLCKPLAIVPTRWNPHCQPTNTMLCCCSGCCSCCWLRRGWSCASQTLLCMPWRGWLRRPTASWTTSVPGGCTQCWSGCCLTSASMRQNGLQQRGRQGSRSRWCMRWMRPRSRQPLQTC